MFSKTDKDCMQSSQIYHAAKDVYKKAKRTDAVFFHSICFTAIISIAWITTLQFTVYVLALYLIVSSFFFSGEFYKRTDFESYCMSHIVYLHLTEERWERFSSSGCHVCYKTGVEQGVLMTWVLIKSSCCVTRQIWPWNKPCDTSMITLYDNFLS